MLTGLCPECRESARAWEDYTPPRGIRIAAGASRDDSLEGLHDRQRTEISDRNTLIGKQLELIRKICTQRHRGGTSC